MTDYVIVSNCFSLTLQWCHCVVLRRRPYFSPLLRSGITQLYSELMQSFLLGWSVTFSQRERLHIDAGPTHLRARPWWDWSPGSPLLGLPGLSTEPSLLTAVHDVLHVQAHEAVGASGCWLVANLWRVPLQNFCLNVCCQSDPCLFCPVLVFCCCGILFDKMYGDIVNVWPLSLSVPTVWSKLTEHLFVVIFIFISF